MGIESIYFIFLCFFTHYMWEIIIVVILEHKMYKFVSVIQLKLRNNQLLLNIENIFYLVSWCYFHFTCVLSSTTASLTQTGMLRSLLLHICCEGQFPYTVQEMGGFIHHLSDSACCALNPPPPFSLVSAQIGLSH